MPVDVVLIRGLTREARHWSGFDKLLQDNETIASVQPIDLVGAGSLVEEKSPLMITKTVEKLESQVSPGSDHLRVIVGLSLGGMAAVAMAEHGKISWDGLVLINTSGRNLAPPWKRIKPRALLKGSPAIWSKNIAYREKAILSISKNHEEGKEELYESWLAIQETAPVPRINSLRQILSGALFKVPDKPPVKHGLLLNSTKDQIVNPICTQKLSRKWAWPVATHPTAGHDISIDDPQWLADQIISFCRRLEKHQQQT